MFAQRDDLSLQTIFIIFVDEIGEKAFTFAVFLWLFSRKSGCCKGL